MNSLLFVAGILMIISPASYLYKVSKKEVRPSVYSWFGWACLMGISIFSQIIHEGWSSGLVNVVLSASSCVAIAVCARFVFKSYSVNKKDLIYLYASGVCVVVYIISGNQWLTTILAIAADLMLAIPTLKVAYKYPDREKSLNWIFALLSWIITLTVVLIRDPFINSLWPIYLLLFNATMTYFIYGRRAAKKIKNNILSTPNAKIVTPLS